MSGILGTSAEAVRRAGALTGSPACFGRCGNGTRPSGGMVTVTATISGSVIPDKLFVDVEVTQP